MILFTAGGSIASAFRAKYPCDIVSARSLSDIELEEYISNADCIIHNAANISCNGIPGCVEDNFLLTKRILDLTARTNPGARFIYLSSMSILRTADSYMDINKMSPYAFSKYLGEIYCLKYPLKALTCIRFSTLFYMDYSKDGLSKMIHDALFLKAITLYSGGNAKRDFIPVKIGIQYIHKLANMEYAPRTINISAGKSHSFLEIAKKIKAMIPFSINDISADNLQDVLHEFSSDDMDRIGRIDFQIDDDISAYIKILSNEDADI